MTGAVQGLGLLDRPAEAPPRRRVALAGCGVVGGGVLQRLLADPRVEVVGVLVRDRSRPRDVDVPDGLLVTDAAALLARRPDILLEALSEAEAGLNLIQAALARGIDVASANKQAVGRDLAALHALATAGGGRLRYAASVGGGAPMIETMRAARAHGPVARFDAVLNGTVNFILSRVEAGDPPAAALAKARAAGFAEENPAADLEGLDAAAKVRLLAYEAFDQALAEDAVIRQPLDLAGIPAAEGGVLRQIGVCTLDGEGRLQASVTVEIAVTDPLYAKLQGERNALRVTCVDGSVFTCEGPGAGRWPTADSLCADLDNLLGGA